MTSKVFNTLAFVSLLFGAYLFGYTRGQIAGAFPWADHVPWACAIACIFAAYAFRYNAKVYSTEC